MCKTTKSPSSGISLKQQNLIKSIKNIREMLNDAIDSLGGYNSVCPVFIFDMEDVEEKISSVHSMLGADYLNLDTAMKKCVKVEKIQELVVNENSSVRDLNIAVLMTHWDYIASVYFLR